MDIPTKIVSVPLPSVLLHVLVSRLIRYYMNYVIYNDIIYVVVNMTNDILPKSILHVLSFRGRTLTLPFAI